MSHATQIQTVYSNGVVRYRFTAGMNPVSNLRARVTLWQLRRTSRRELGRIDDNILRDIGIDRVAANIEARKFFWQE